MIVNMTVSRVREIGPADRTHPEKGDADQGFYTMLASMMSGKASQRTGVQTAMAQKTGTETGKRTGRRKDTGEDETAETESGDERFREEFDAFAALLQGQTGGAEGLPLGFVQIDRNADGFVPMIPGTAGLPAVTADGTGEATMPPAPMETVEAFLGQAGVFEIEDRESQSDLLLTPQQAGTQQASLTDAGYQAEADLQQIPYTAANVQADTAPVQAHDLMRIVSENRSYNGPVTAPEMQLQYLSVSAEPETTIPGTGIMADRMLGREAAKSAIPIAAESSKSGTAETTFGTAAGKADLPASGDIPVTVSHAQDSDTVKAKGTFDQAVYEAQKTMRGDFRPKSLPGDDEEQTVPALQNLAAGTAEIRSREPVQTAAPLKESEEPAEAEILHQVTTGIARGLEEGEKEFVIRLKPEGLGEITVLMAQKSGKLVLNIVASSAQTEKLISGEAAGLRESLRVYNAELQQVTSTEANPDAYSYLSGQNAQTGSGERFDQWQFAEQQRQAGVSYAADDAADPADQTAAGQNSPQIRSLLNRYI